MRPSAYAYLEMLVARCIAMIGPFGIAVISARMLGPEGQGRYYYVITLATIGAQFASFGIHASNTYRVAKQPSLLSPILTNSAWIAIVGGSVAACVVAAFDLAIEGAMRLGVSLLFVLPLCPLILFFLYLSNIAIAVSRTTLFNGLILLNSALSLAAIAVAAYVLPTINVFLSALVGSFLMTCIMSWILVARDCAISWRFDPALFKDGLAFAARAHVVSLVAFLMARTGVVVLRHYGAFADLGHWSIAVQISDALMLLPATVGLLLFPSLVRADAVRRWNDFKSVTVQLSAVMAVFCLVIAGLIFPLIEVAFGPAYTQTASIMLALLPGVFFLAVTSTVSQFLSAFGFPWSQLVVWIMGFILQVVLSMLLFDKFGVLGLAWVQSGCAAFVCLWLFMKALEYAPGRGSAASLRQ
jgi:O-antigen/teichoic acid export membrane protein